MRPSTVTQSVLSERAPQLSLAAASHLVGETWGLPAPRTTSLASERDLNILVDDSHVLKVSNPAEPAEVVDMEVAAMAHAARCDPELPLPRTVPTLTGDSIHPITDESGRRCLTRLITIVPGAPLEGSPITEDMAEQVGRAAARVSVALQGFYHPAAGDRDLDWDLRRLPQAARTAQDAGQLSLNDPLWELIQRATPALGVSSHLPSGIQHADVTLTNVLASDGLVSGIIDFGDMHHTANACDLAVSLTSVIRNTAEIQLAGTWDLAASVIRGYQRHRLLTDAEVDALGAMVLARLAVGILISRTRAAVHTENIAYITQYDDAADRILDVMGGLSLEELSARFHRMAGTRGSQTSVDTDRLAARRAEVMGGSAAPLFYRSPVQMVAGEGPWLIDETGRRYLDAYNNVAVVGHADPVVVGRVSRQLARLNTHSRYLHTEIVELAERLVATMPEGLDTCLFTTSGTEANELAWRLATEATGAEGAIIVEHSYHGSTRWMADLSSNEWPPGHRPAAVGTFEAPVGSGELSSAVAAQRASAATADLATRGYRPALVIADSGFTSEGVHDAPASYFRGLVEGAHAAGALYVADEVQVGYGRTGPDLWRFRQAGITPDIVTLGKPMGAGYPIGAVITRRELVDRFAGRYEYFSTFAATPAAAAAGNAVLDVLEDRRLPQRAVDVGGYLKARLQALAAESTLIGEVRGFGLVVGADIVADSPRATARDLLEGLVDRRVLAGLTGPRGNVLKIRPPLVWEERHVDLFIDRLADALKGLSD